MKRTAILCMCCALIGGLLWQCGGGDDNPDPGPGPEPWPWGDKVLLATATLPISTEGNGSQAQANRIQESYDDPMLYCQEQKTKSACEAEGCFWNTTGKQCTAPNWPISLTIASFFKFLVAFHPDIPAKIDPKPVKLGAINPITLQDNRLLLLNFKEVEMNVSSPTDGLIGGQEPSVKVKLTLHDCTPETVDPNTPLDDTGIAVKKWEGDPHVPQISSITETCDVYGDFTDVWAQTYSGQVVVNYLGTPKNCTVDDDCTLPYHCVDGRCVANPNPAGNKIVFVTSYQWHGDMKGLGGADKICNQYWTAANPAQKRNFVALLSGVTVSGCPLNCHITDTQPALGRISDPPEGAIWVLWDTKDPTTGTPVAANKSELTGGLLRHAINVDEKGAAVTTNLKVWTGSMMDMTADQSSYQCVGAFGGEAWTSTSNEWRGTYGDLSKKDKNWIQSNASSCLTYANRLYCFESQAAP